MLHGREFYCFEDFQKNNLNWKKGNYYRLGYEENGLFYLLKPNFNGYEGLTKEELDNHFCDIY